MTEEEPFAAVEGMWKGSRMRHDVTTGKRNGLGRSRERGFASDHV